MEITCKSYRQKFKGEPSAEKQEKRIAVKSAMAGRNLKVYYIG